MASAPPASNASGACNGALGGGRPTANGSANERVGTAQHQTAQRPGRERGATHAQARIGTKPSGAARGSADMMSEDAKFALGF